MSIKQFLIIARGWKWDGSTQGSVCLLRQAAKNLCAQSERNKSMRTGSLQRAESGVGMPCGKARLFRWKMVLRLVSPAWAHGRPAFRTAWFMRTMISAVATWINHVGRIKLLLNDAQYFPRCFTSQSEITFVDVVVATWDFKSRGCFNFSSLFPSNSHGFGNTSR